MKLRWMLTITVLAILVAASGVIITGCETPAPLPPPGPAEEEMPIVKQAIANQLKLTLNDVPDQKHFQAMNATEADLVAILKALEDTWAIKFAPELTQSPVKLDDVTALRIAIIAHTERRSAAVTRQASQPVTPPKAAPEPR